MRKYRLEKDIKKRIYKVTVGGFFRTVLREFPFTEYQAAKEYLKKKASGDRPSRVSILDAYGHVMVQWEYKKPVPKPYETKPRKPK